jgi:hypothetical protein
MPSKSGRVGERNGGIDLVVAARVLACGEATAVSQARRSGKEKGAKGRSKTESLKQEIRQG